MTSHDNAEFTFSWLALKLLGKGLYSNPWSALSELVANGLDAGAKNVHVYVDATDKANATVEVIDDGVGMNRDDIDTYVKVGYNKREAALSAPSEHDDAQRYMGRKGIGKLAALYLSQHFYLYTRRDGVTTTWELDAREGRVTDAEHPRLQSTTTPQQTPNTELWEAQESGTRITLLGVNLAGYGPRAIEGLDSRLANQFLLSDQSGACIRMWVRTRSDAQTPDYREVQKQVAFKNLAMVASSFIEGDAIPVEISELHESVRIPAKGLPGGYYEHRPEHDKFHVDPAEDEAWSEIAESVDIDRRTYDGVPFRLSGWIGLHATIDQGPGQQNDPRFVKNKYYNPAQIRVYVRGKLASDRLLSQLGITGTYANYIEGEITFDLLDDDQLPDIATSNRQDFDETDNRVTLLRALVRPIVRRLVQQRNRLAGEISAEVAAEKLRIETASKAVFTNQLGADLAHYQDIPQRVRDELQAVITNKIQGDVTPKTVFRVFISHASADKLLADLIYETLLAQGATTSEIFYTSATGAMDQLKDTRALSAIIKDSITNSNTLIFYMTSRNFMRSQYCLFEGGAGWATRAVSEYLKLNVDYRSIPAFLTHGQSELTLLAEDAIELRPDVHNYLIECILNPMIAHLNAGREIDGANPIELLELPEVPSELELRKAGKTADEFFNPILAENWRLLVARDVAAYVHEYLGKE